MLAGLSDGKSPITHSLTRQGQASPAFRQMGESYNRNVEECKMFDFIIDMIADIAEIFVDLWVNKVTNRKKKSNIDSGLISQQQVAQDGK